MKLLNKLLPIASIGAIAGITAPVLCSCGNMEELTKYEAKLTGPDAIDEGKVTQTYFESSNIKEILTDDFKVFARAYAEDQIYYEEEDTLNYVKGYISNINVEKKTTTDAATYYLLSFDIGMEYSITSQYISSSNEKDDVTTNSTRIDNLTAKVSNIPYMTSYQTSPSGTTITPNTTLTFAQWTTLNENWSIKLKLINNDHSKVVAKDGTLLQEVYLKEIEKDNTYNKDNEPDEDVIKYCSIQNSNYLKKIKHD